MAILSFSTLPTLTQAALIISLCWLLKWLAFGMWRMFVSKSPFRDLPGPQPVSWSVGNLGQLFNAKGLPFHQSLVDMYGGMVKVYGFFGDEQLYVSDPNALHTIIIKEQDAFEETAVFTETNKVIFGPGLVATTGSQHERQRRVVNPIFAVPHLRRLVPTFYHIADKLADVMASEIEAHHAGQVSGSPRKVMDVQNWMCRVALESVGRTVLGYSFDPLDSPHNNPYTSAIKELVPTLFSLSLVRQFAPFLAKLGPPSFRRRLVEWIPHKGVQKVKDMSDLMHNTALEILRSKRGDIAHEDSIYASDNKADSAEVPEGKDIISVLLRANEKAKSNGGEQLSDLELTGQMSVLIFGAQDTTSACLSRILYELSQRRDIQNRLREEILEAKRQNSGVGDDGHLEHDTLQRLPWLDAVLKETLRLYPPVPFVRRTALKDTIVPYSRAEDGVSSMSSVTIPAGTTMFVSIAGSNRLESVWGPDAKVWNPERWVNDNHGGSNSQLKLPGVYSGTLAFLGGSRSCVGYKFALLEMKILLATLLSRFTFSCTDDEIVWNMSQIIAPSVRKRLVTGEVSEEKGLPLVMEIL